jgi:hypothetical protein
LGYLEQLKKFKGDILNLINFDLPQTQDGNWMAIKDFRTEDFAKIPKLMKNMYDNIKKIEPEFNFTINFENQSSAYLEDSTTHYEKLIIEQTYQDQNNTLSVLIPRLMHSNFFLLNGSYYVPLLFLEKAPIDRILNEEANKNKIFINLNAVYNFTFDFQKKMVQFRSKLIPLSVFLRIMFQHDKDYLVTLLDLDLIEKTTYTKEEYKKFVKNFLDFYKWEYFNDIDITEWMDEYFLLDYYREIFNDYYGLTNLKDIIKKVVDLYVTNEDIDMATLSNRRVVLVEYLIRPLFEIYVRLLYGIIDKKSQNFLPTINEFAVTTTGFNGLLHRGQLFDISNPYPLPLINKVSQDIQIIKQGRLPKSWQRNDESGFGVICPISVSPQNMGTNLVFTSSAKINKWGRLKINTVAGEINGTEII